ncbi:MAG TPA: protein kinase [Actinomycetota bacterium]|nr:protein kinase [Actinomycetota bacterium]
MAIGPGSTIGGRYRVQRRAWDGSAGEAWIALDTVLDRTVLVQTFPASAQEAVHHAVATAAQVSHPGLSQIYDITNEPPGIVFENAAGGRLADRKEGALPVPLASAVVCQLAGALAALHEQSVTHGAVGPRTVMFDEEGRAKLSGTAVASALGDGSAEGYTPSGEASDEERDRYGLAAIAYRLFTGRDPGPDAPPARTAKKTVPPEVDALLARGLARERSVRPSLAEFQRVLSPLAASAEPLDRGPGFIRQEARWLVPAILLVALGVAAVVVGVGTGAIKIGGGEETPEPQASQSALEARADDFDPEGDGEEHSEQAARVLDGTDKGWSTLGYNSASLGGLKKGVGLVFDLGSRQTITRIEVRTSLEGWRAEWRVADADGDAADDFETVTDFTATGQTLTLPRPTEGRYWLLWITRLTNNGSGSNIPFQAQVSEVEFFAA